MKLLINAWSRYLSKDEVEEHMIALCQASQEDKECMVADTFGIFEGNVAADATIKEQAPGFKVCNYTVGVNRFYKDRNGEEVNEVSYFDCESYGSLADYDFENAKKGFRMRLVGRLKQKTCTDENGKTFSKICVVVEHTEYYDKQTSKNPTENKTEDCQF